MRNIINSSIIFLSIILLSACTKHSSNETYRVGEIGVSKAVEYGTVIGVRQVDIAPHSSGVGMLLGAGAAGGGASYIGNGSGQTWATVGGAIAGAVIGDAIEKEMNKTSGVEYILHMRNGETKSIVQEINPENPLLTKGDKVMLQYCDANDYQKKCDQGDSFQRLIPVDEFPLEPQTKKSNKHKRNAK